MSEIYEILKPSCQTQLLEELKIALSLKTSELNNMQLQLRESRYQISELKKRKKQLQREMRILSLKGLNISQSLIKVLDELERLSKQNQILNEQILIYKKKLEQPSMIMDQVCERISENSVSNNLQNRRGLNLTTEITIPLPQKQESLELKQIVIIIQSYLKQYAFRLSITGKEAQIKQKVQKEKCTLLNLIEDLQIDGSQNQSKQSFKKGKNNGFLTNLFPRIW